MQKKFEVSPPPNAVIFSHKFPFPETFPRVPCVTDFLDESPLLYVTCKWLGSDGIPFRLQPHDIDQARPTLVEYSFEAGKQTVVVLEKAAGLIGVPFAKEVLGVALALIDACEV